MGRRSAALTVVAMTTAEEKRRGKGSAGLAVFAGATIGAVVGGWIGASTYQVEPEYEIVAIGGQLRALVVGAIVFMVIGGIVGLGLWSIAVRERRGPRQDEEWHQEWQDQGK
jgi:MFS family permease